MKTTITNNQQLHQLRAHCYQTHRQCSSVPPQGHSHITHYTTVTYNSQQQSYIARGDGNLGSSERVAHSSLSSGHSGPCPTAPPHYEPQQTKLSSPTIINYIIDSENIATTPREQTHRQCSSVPPAGHNHITHYTTITYNSQQQLHIARGGGNLGASERTRVVVHSSLSSGHSGPCPTAPPHYKLQQPKLSILLDVQGLGRACTGIEVSVYRDLYPKTTYLRI